MITKHPDFLVSIRCMTYNQAPYIEDAMNGFCMQQTKFPFLAIICDDASTDGEPDVIRQYLNNNFLIFSSSEWCTKEACFIFACHRTNINCFFLVILLKNNYYSLRKSKKHLWNDWESSVKYVAYCEGDDYWIDNNKLQKEFDYLEHTPECSLVFTNRRYLANGTFTTTYESKKIYGQVDLLSGFVPGLQTIMYKKMYNIELMCSSIIPGVNGDIGYAYICSLLGELHCIPDVTAVYRYSGKGVFSSLKLQQRYETAIKHYYHFHECLNFPNNRALSSFYLWQLSTITLEHIKMKQWKQLFRNLTFVLKHCPDIQTKCRLLLRYIIQTAKELYKVMQNKLRKIVT